MKLIRIQQQFEFQFLQILLIYYNFNRMTFKQEYLHRNGPYIFDFAQERVTVKAKIMQLVKNFHPNQWAIRGIQPFSYFQSFKQVYGISSQQITQIIIQLLSYLKDSHLSCQGAISVMKTLVGLKQYKIRSTQSLKFDNKYFIQKLKHFGKFGIPYPLKNSDTYVENLIKMIKIYSKYGQEYFQDLIQLAIQERDIKYLAIFIKSIKNQSTAQKVLDYIFQQSSLFERDTSFFYIIAQLTLEFPLLNLNSYHQTLSQQIIKSITTIVDPSTDQQLKKLTTDDPSIGVQCTLKSVARILINCLRPVTEPGWQKNWSRIQRVFSIIGGLVDHSHQVQCMGEFLIFIKEFVKMFQFKYRKQRGMYEQINEDFVEQFNGTPSTVLVLSQKYISLFNQIMMPLVPELLYFQDGQVIAAKILTDLAMFQPIQYMSFILSTIKIYLSKDLTICSTYTSKMTILFLQQYIVKNYLGQRQFTLMIECSQLLLDALETLGISENLDILELVMRTYMYFPQKLIQENPMLESLTQDIINIIYLNLDPMSINLQATEGDEAELYTDFKNIYFNFIIRLNQKQTESLSDKILYKIKSNVPSHRQAYQFITVALSFKNPNLAKKILDQVYKNLIVRLQGNNGNGIKKSAPLQISQQIFPMHKQYSFLTRNQQHIRWYSSLLQCAFQYNPENVVANWAKLQIIIVIMLRQVENLSIFDWGMDILFNMIINLQHIHLHPSQFYKNSNRTYQTMKDVRWRHPSSSSIQLLVHIKNTFYDSITKYMLNRYQKVLDKSEKAQRLKSQKIVEIIFDKPQTSVGPKPIEVKQFINEILDCLLVPSTPTSEDIEEKKYINKLLSIQYTVFSALQMRAQFTSNQVLPEISSVFIKELGSLRKNAIEHLKWILQLMGHYNCLYDPAILKLFHFFWREAHDQLYYSAGIQATNDKLNPFFYPVSYKKKQQFQNSFLIMTECYVTFMMRIQLFSMLRPMALLNNPQYLQYTVPLTFSSALDCSLKSYVPLNINPHTSFHFQILNLCRLKLSLYNSDSYIRKSISYSKSNNQDLSKIQKEKYLGAIRVIINNYKRNLNIFLYPCCMRDQTCWYSLQEILEISQYLQKKNDKVGIIQILYLLIVFSFDFKGVHIYKSIVNQVEKNSSMFDEDDQIMLNTIISFVRFIIEKINVQLAKKFYQKDATVLVLLLICFSEFIPIHHEIYQQIVPLIISITLKKTEDMMNMGKTFLFRILNRFIKKKTQIVAIENIPIKRSYSDFIAYRHLGGKTAQNTEQPAYNLITNKNENYYYPLAHLNYINRQVLNPSIPNQQILIKKICNQEIVRQIFKALLSDTQLKNQQSQVDVSYLSEEQPKRIYSNGHKLINYILDSNPKKLNIFLSFIDNFSNYPICFYHRFFRKMMINGGTDTVKIMQKIAKQFIKSRQMQEVKLCQFLLAQILPFCPKDEDFYSFYTNFLVTCSKQQFQFANGCLLITFCIDWRVSKLIFNSIITKMREQKGPSRLRHLQVFNNYLLCTGRFAQQEAKNGILYLMKGIEQGTDQVSQLIVSMLIYCFIIPINLKLLDKWVKESEFELAQKSKIYKLDSHTGYEINQQVRLIIKQIVNKTKQQTDLESKNLKVYSKIAYKILSNIFVHRFNDQFYNLFKDTMLYIVNKPLEEGGYDEQIVSQLKDSEYPQHIYEDLIKQLKNMEGNTINVQKKKLRYIESVVLNKIFCMNKVQIPDIFTSINEKSVAIDHIVAVSNMARIMKGEELTAEVERVIGSKQKSTKNLNFLMAYLLAAGTRDFQWRQKVLNQILSFKKYKIVKQFVSYWWKGRNPETERQQRLCMLVRSVENPYSYFA